MYASVYTDMLPHTPSPVKLHTLMRTCGTFSLWTCTYNQARSWAWALWVKGIHNIHIWIYQIVSSIVVSWRMYRYVWILIPAVPCGICGNISESQQGPFLSHSHITKQIMLEMSDISSCVCEGQIFHLTVLNFSHSLTAWVFLRCMQAGHPPSRHTIWWSVSLWII